MSATAAPITADEYYDRTVVGERTQLVEGRILVNEPKLIHMELQGRLYRALMSWVDAGDGRGRAFLATDVRIDAHNVFAPDLLWFADGHVPPRLDAYPDRLPDLCIEIRSAGTWRYDIGAKLRRYEEAGLPELWLVDDQADTVLVYRRSAPNAASFDLASELTLVDELASPQLPEFALPLASLFER